MPHHKPHKPHKVIAYTWVDGILHIEEKILASLEHAIAHISSIVYHSVKVYDEDGHLVDVMNHYAPNDTYA